MLWTPPVDVDVDVADGDYCSYFTGELQFFHRSRAYLSWFNFKGGDQQKKVNLLSGGERNRLNLARTLKQVRAAVTAYIALYALREVACG